MPNTLLPTAVVARRLGYTPRHVARLVERGEIKPAMTAPGARGAYLFRRADVEALAERRAIASQATDQADVGAVA